MKEKYLGKLDLDSDVKQRIGKGLITTHVSLFTGCGGLDLGFSHAGIETRVMIEYSHSCCETLRRNWTWEQLKTWKDENGNPEWTSHEELIKKAKQHQETKNKITEENKDDFIDSGVESWYHFPEPVIMERDICEVTSEEIMKKGNLQIGECSIVSGGFPCQGFSLAGMRVLNDPRNKLYKQFVRIVDDLKPASIMGENVPGLVSMGKGHVIQQICEDFANCGYDISWDILDAADFGVPQHRKRVILIGKRIDMFRIREDGSPAFHIAVGPGEISHPFLFKERLKRWRTKESKELLEKIEADPRCSFREKKIKINKGQQTL